MTDGTKSQRFCGSRTSKASLSFYTRSSSKSLKRFFSGSAYLKLAVENRDYTKQRLHETLSVSCSLSKITKPLNYYDIWSDRYKVIECFLVMKLFI
jgi:hypothetical protein